MTVVRREVAIEGDEMRTYEYRTYYCFGVPIWTNKVLVHSVRSRIVVLKPGDIINK